MGSGSESKRFGSVALNIGTISRIEFIVQVCVFLFIYFDLLFLFFNIQEEKIKPRVAELQRLLSKHRQLTKSRRKIAKPPNCPHHQQLPVGPSLPQGIVPCLRPAPPLVQNRPSQPVAAGHPPPEWAVRRPKSSSRKLRYKIHRFFQNRGGCKKNSYV